MDAVDAEHLADGVEKNVAGIDDGFVEIDGAVALRAPAMKRPAVKFGVAGAVDGGVCGNGFGIQHRRGHHDFENGAGRELRLNRAIEQRRVRIGIELCPFGCGNAHGEIVGIECGAADHGQNFAGARVHRDDGAFLVLHVVFGDGLQIVIDRQLNRLAGNRFDVVESAHGLADAVDDDAAHAVGAFEGFVVLALEAGFADDVAGAVVAVALVELLRRNFTDVADRVREHFAVRVAAALNHHQFEHGKIGAVRFHECDVRLARGGLDYDGLKFRLVLGGIELLLQIFAADSQAVFDLRQALLEGLRVVAKQQNAERRIAIHEHAAFAVEHRRRAGQ